MEEVESGLDKLGKNSAIDSKHVGIMGFSLGAYLSLSVGALDWDKISAIVEYYGGMPPQFDTQAASMPPTLILHGDADSLVPVAQAHSLDDMLTKANRPHEIHIYPGAQHAFNFASIPMWYNKTAAD